MVVKVLLLLAALVLAVAGRCPVPCRCPSADLANCSSSDLTRPPSERFDVDLLKLNLSNNALMVLDESSLRDLELQSLEELDLSANLINLLHRDAFLSLPNLRTLNLSFNLITDIDPGTFAHNPGLQWLSLSRNLFFSPPLLQSPSLKVLNLSSCDLRDVPADTFRGVPGLQELCLSHNRIEMLGSLQGTLQVKTLDLSYNHLLSLTPELLNSLPSLSKLDVSNNWIYTLIPDVIARLVNVIDSRALEGNPWVCDCFLFNTTYSWCRDNFETLSILCSSPPSLKGKLWTAYEEAGCDDRVDFADYIDLVDEEVEMMDDEGVIFDEMIDADGAVDDGDLLFDEVSVMDDVQVRLNLKTAEDTGGEFEVNYMHTSVLFGSLCLCLMAVALVLWLRLTATTPTRTGPCDKETEKTSLRWNQV